MWGKVFSFNCPMLQNWPRLFLFFHLLYKKMQFITGATKLLLRSRLSIWITHFSTPRTLCVNTTLLVLVRSSDWTRPCLPLFVVLYHYQMHAGMFYPQKVQTKYYAYTMTFQAQADPLPWTPLAQFGTQCMRQGGRLLFHHRWGDTDVIHSSKRLGRRIRCKTNMLNVTWLEMTN